MDQKQVEIWQAIPSGETEKIRIWDLAPHVVQKQVPAHTQRLFLKRMGSAEQHGSAPTLQAALARAGRPATSRGLPLNRKHNLP